MLVQDVLLILIAGQVMALVRLLLEEEEVDAGEIEGVCACIPNGGGGGGEGRE